MISSSYFFYSSWTLSNPSLWNTTVTVSRNLRTSSALPPPSSISSTTTPSSIDWRSVDGVSYVSTSRNQHNPNYCGACWSFAATSALSDRFRIASSSSTSHGHPASIREINPSMQVILNCDTYDNGCHGGDPLTAYRYIHENGIPEETCQLYEATGHDVVRLSLLFPFSICYTPTTRVIRVRRWTYVWIVLLGRLCCSGTLRYVSCGRVRIGERYVFFLLCFFTFLHTDIYRYGEYDGWDFWTRSDCVYCCCNGSFRELLWWYFSWRHRCEIFGSLDFGRWIWYLWGWWLIIGSDVTVGVCIFSSSSSSSFVHSHSLTLKVPSGVRTVGFESYVDCGLREYHLYLSLHIHK